MKIVIIGAEAAGASAAAKLKRVAPKADVVVYEKTDTITFGACGLPYFVGDFFSDPNFMVSRTVEQFANNDIAIKTNHEVIAVNSAAKRVTVKNLATGEIGEDRYDYLLIATGASPIIPPIDNADLTHVFTLKTMADGLALKPVAHMSEIQEVTVIGGGYIGLEVADVMLRLGKNVRIIQLDQRVLAESFDQDIAHILEKELTEAGVQIHLAETLKALRGDTRVTGVVTDKSEYSSDLVVICTGVRPNTQFLQDTDIAMLPNGAIIIDAHGRTNVDGIFAAGDCATVSHLLKKAPAYIPLATTANKIGRIAGENMAGQARVFPGTLGTAAIKVNSLEAGRTGITEAEAAKSNIPYKTVLVKDKNHSNFLPEQADIWVKLIYHSQTKKLLGGQVVGGNGAALRANILATAIWNGMTVEQLGLMDLLYAPPFSRPWDVLNIAANAAR